MTRLRIDLLSPPFAGHLHPILGIARILQSDYEVRVLTTANALPSVRAAGLTGVAILEGWEDRLMTLVNTPHPVRSNPVRMLKQLSQALTIQHQVRIELNALYEASRPALVIADFTLAAVGAVAEGLGISWWTVLPSPSVLEGGNAPPSYLGGLKPMSGVWGRLRNRVGWSLIRAFKRLVSALYRKRLRDIGLKSVYRPDGSEAAYSNERILLLGSQSIEFRDDWPECARLLPPILYTPPCTSENLDFIEGRQYVLVTLGTHLKFAKDDFVEVIKNLAHDMPEVSFHFTDGLTGSASATHERNFSRFPYINYSDSLKHYSLVVHHAGSGIMYHCLVAGCPSVVYPVDYDQFDNAARLEWAGAAIWLRHPEDLKAAATLVLSDHSIRSRCLELAKELDLDSGTPLKAELASWARTTLVRDNRDQRSAGSVDGLAKIGEARTGDR